MKRRTWFVQQQCLGIYSIQQKGIELRRGFSRVLLGMDGAFGALTVGDIIDPEDHFASNVIIFFWRLWGFIADQL